MRRKLIQQEAFEQIANNSITTAQHELTEAENILARTLGKDNLSLHSFDQSTVLYETLDDTYVHAGYEIKNNQITYNGVQELIIDHESKKNKRKGILSEMVDAILVDKAEKAEQLFLDYLGVYPWNEAKKIAFGEMSHKGKNPFAKKGKHKEKFNLFKSKAKKAGRKVEEAYTVAANVRDYVDFMRVGPSLAESVTKTDDKGNVVDVRIPASKARNESKILSYDWKTLNQKVSTLRKEALSLYENVDFCKQMAELKRQNAFSNTQALEEVLENVVRSWPQVLYVTQSELAQVVAEALQTLSASNYDDQSCAFMAEGILRTAHKAFQERAAQVLHLASAQKCEEGSDPYEHFQTVVEDFYPAVDEKFGLERKVFEDLYSSLEGIYRTADRRGDTNLQEATAEYLNELAHVLNDQAKPDLDLAEEVATWLADFIETNLDGGAWTVSNKPHVTVSGDHPEMGKKAAHSYTPSKDSSGNWGDELPMIGQDSMEYKSGKHSKQARSSSWGNEENKDTFPQLKNPYVPKPFGDYTMKGEKGVDKDTFGQHHATWTSQDTWPKLQNPYTPKAETPKTYKMNKGKEKDLVVDK